MENYDAIVDEIAPLLIKHWREIARNRDRIKLNPDYRVYTALGQQKRVRIFSARIDGVLCGYAIYFVKNHPHYKDHTWAVSDIFWIDPDMRGCGVGRGLFKFVEESLRMEGVHVMHTTSKSAHPAARQLLDSLGHELIEYGHAKVLQWE